MKEREMWRVMSMSSRGRPGPDPGICAHGEIPAGAAGCVDCLVEVAEAARAHLAAWDAFVNVRPGDYMQAGAKSDACNRTEKALRAALAALDGRGP